VTRTALVGCGDVSVVHLSAIAALPQAELVGVADVDPARAKATSAPAFDSLENLIDAVRPDVVHICTPHDQHADLAVEALDRGVAVLLEKPVARTVADAERVIAAAGTHPDVKIGVCLQNRYNPPVAAARDLLASGELGAVRGGSATVFWHRDAAYYANRPWRGHYAESGGGVLINQAIHTVDLMQWLLGDVTGVRGHAGTYGLDGVIDVEDTAHLLLDHDGGARSVVFATNTNVVDAPVTIDIITEHAALHLRGDLTVTYADGRVEVVEQPPVVTGGRAYWGASHQLLIADFYQRLTDPEPFWITPAEGTKSLRIIDQIYRQSI
jgi:UDP-N-acetyl-2-amino-2-deoxyglucuronate dehydrogenase